MTTLDHPPTPGPPPGRDRRPLLLRRPGFFALTAAIFLQTLTDGAFKMFATLWALDQPGVDLGRVSALTGGIYVLPFLLFSGAAGGWADRLSKRRIALLVKTAGLGIVLLAGAVLMNPTTAGFLLVLFLLGVHSAFFTPAKIGLIPEMIPERELSNANGIIQIGIFMAILLAPLLAVELRRPGYSASGVFGVFLALAVADVAAGWGIDRVPPAGGTRPIDWNPLRSFWVDMKEIRQDRPLFLSVLGIGYFWLAGTLIFIGLPLYARGPLGVGDPELARLMTALSVGIAVGSGLAGKLSGQTVELGLVPLGALGLGVFSLDLVFSAPSLSRATVDLALVGISSGFFVVPLSALLQLRSPPARRGQIIATSNVVCFIGIGGASVVYAFLTDRAALGLGPEEAWLWVSLGALAATVYVFSLLVPETIRFLAWILTHSLYRMTLIGRDNIPRQGGALLICNHLSYADPFLVSAAVPRRLRFMMMRPLFDYRPLTWFFRLMGAIPISPSDGPKRFMASMAQARQALREGHVVCLFAEGAISRNAQTLGFRKGLEVIAKDLRVPIIPMHLDRVWGSVFSFAGGRFLWKMPSHIPYPVTATIGAPLPGDAKADAVRQAVLDLGSQAFEHRLAGLLPLHRAFFRLARRQWFLPAVADSSGLRLGYGRLATGAFLLARRLGAVLDESRHVGVLLPPGVPGVVVNLALLFAGRVPVNLNYSLGRGVVEAICRDAGVTRVLTARRMLEALHWGEESRAVFVEDLPRPGRLTGLAAFLALRLLPPRWAERRFAPAAEVPLESPATILYTSGSTGAPKGVVLTHKNIHANIQGLQETYRLTARDAILGVLPFFHSFGFTGTLWLPLLAGCRAVYHRSPLEPAAIRQLLVKERATILLATPTFLQMWAKKMTREDLAGLRFVLTGAEKLSQPFARGFTESFGVPLLEGYGTTELSPAACVSVLDVHDQREHQVGHKPGKVGRPLPGVSVKIVHPDTGERLPEGTPGLLWVKGPNVMAGYWRQPGKTAEVIRDGWYVTGDIATVDEDGFVEITDRLSRFSKIGGEMVPHMLVEQTLADLSGEPEARFLVLSAVCDKKGEKLAVLTHNLRQTVDALMDRLDKSDMPQLWRPDRRCFFPVDVWPTLASGKVDLVSARALLAARLGGDAPGRAPL